MLTDRFWIVHFSKTPILGTLSIWIGPLLRTFSSKQAPIAQPLAKTLVRIAASCYRSNADKYYSTDFLRRAIRFLSVLPVFGQLLFSRRTFGVADDEIVSHPMKKNKMIGHKICNVWYFILGSDIMILTLHICKTCRLSNDVHNQGLISHKRRI